jgi:hypothetical protein
MTGGFRQEYPKDRSQPQAAQRVAAFLSLVEIEHFEPPRKAGNCRKRLRGKMLEISFEANDSARGMPRDPKSLREREIHGFRSGPTPVGPAKQG